MKAREIIAEELFWPFEGVYGDPSETANDYAARIVSQLAKAGFVILPKEPSEEARLAGWNTWVDMWPSVEPLSRGFFDGVYCSMRDAMISHAEGEKG